MSQQQQHTPRPTQRPTTNDRIAWQTYWQVQNQPWRTEPEISPKRQAELEHCRAIVPSIHQGIYPFRGMKLERADLEWLLATHEGGRGPVQWDDETERERKGLDMRGADLNQIDLSDLPLTRLIGGPTFQEWGKISEELRMMASVHMEKAHLREARLERANLREARLEGADLNRARLERANLSEARLERAHLFGARLEGADLFGARLEGAHLRGARLEGAYLSNIILGDKKHIGPWLADVQWGSSTNLAVVDWSQVNILREEYQAQQKRTSRGERKDTYTRLMEYKTAVRANRQLAVALQSQGLNEEAARFAYRAQHLQRSVLGRQHKVGQYLFSGFLDLIAGYGYKPGRSVLAYLLLVAGFALAFYSFGHLKWYEALVVSLTAFHGRGFFSQQYQPGDPQSIIAAIEAVVGLLIEISFIATFTQRFFGK
ncbi:MAG TPA: pentapeptide repeat-containing protein [Ktedonobacteraceae bacterium]|nr:pentapeptide repeat-containing protein [Ktedonobacteraceae bacterium]